LVLHIPTILGLSAIDLAVQLPYQRFAVPLIIIVKGAVKDKRGVSG
jgi:hypothetical protein